MQQKLAISKWTLPTSKIHARQDHCKWLQYEGYEGLLYCKHICLATRDRLFRPSGWLATKTVWVSDVSEKGGFVELLISRAFDQQSHKLVDYVPSSKKARLAILRVLLPSSAGNSGYALHYT